MQKQTERLRENREKERKTVWFITCNGVENGLITQAQLEKLARLKNHLLRNYLLGLDKPPQILCGPDHQQQQAAEILGLPPNNYFGQYSDLEHARPSILSRIIDLDDNSIIVASSKILWALVVAKVRSKDGRVIERPLRFSFSGKLENCTLYQIIINTSSRQVLYIGRPEQKKPKWLNEKNRENQEDSS
jgi:hypothetical protein